MKSLKAQMYVALVCVVLGLMLAYQFRAVKNISSIASSKKVLELQAQVNEAKKQKESLENSIKELEKKIEGFERQAANTNGVASSLKNELDRVRIIAGLTKVEGPGIVVTVTPKSQNLAGKEPSQVSFVHLLLLINELNASGAEAIMINNQRIVSNTQIRDAGSMVVINDVRLSPFDKFEIKAIGDPTTLDVAINMAGGVKQELSYYGIEVKTQKTNSVQILKYNKVPEYKYAKIEKEGE